MCTHSAYMIYLKGPGTLGYAQKFALDIDNFDFLQKAEAVKLIRQTHLMQQQPERSIIVPNVLKGLSFVTRFSKRGLPHTSTSMNLGEHNIVFKKDTNLKFSTSLNLCWISLLTKFQSNTFSQSEVMICQSW